MKRREQEGLLPKRITEAEQIEKLLRGEGQGRGLSEFERMELVRRRTEQMERKVQREEQLMRAQNQGDHVERVLLVNDRYIDAINAKLKILDQILVYILKLLIED